MTVAWKLSAKSVAQRSARATESVSFVQKRFSHNHEGLKEFQRETSAFCVTFQGSIDLSFGDLRLVSRPWSFKPIALASGKRFQPFCTLFRMKCYAHSLSFKSERVWNFETSYCWFAPDVMAAMLVVSPLVTKLHFHVNSSLLYWPSIWPPNQVVPNQEFVVFRSHEMLRRPLLIYLNCLCSLCFPFSFCLFFFFKGTVIVWKRENRKKHVNWCCANKNSNLNKNECGVFK